MPPARPRPPPSGAAAAAAKEQKEIAKWWKKQHAEKVTLRAHGWVFPPATFDVEVAPGWDVQAAVDACRPGGCVLLLPGKHKGPMVLRTGKDVHVFGRGRATLQTAAGEVITSSSDASTIDGLIVRTGAHASGSGHYGILITAGRLRVQACDVSSQSRSGICVRGPAADPNIVDCKVHDCARANIEFSGGCQGTADHCT